MDKIVKALAFDNTVRIYVAVATETVQEIRNRLQTTREVTAALGRLSIATAMIGAMDSYDARTHVRIDADGLAGKLYADADAYGNVRAYAQYPLVQLPANDKGKLDVAGVVGKNGFLNITKDFGMKEKFTGQTEIVSGELGEDFAHYFTVSQQTPSAVGLGVLTDDVEVKVAGGFIAQLLPGATEEVIVQLEANLKKIPTLLGYLLEHTTEELLSVLASNTEEILEEIPLTYQCTCSKDRFVEAMAALPLTDLNEMITDNTGEEVICHYCNQAFEITVDDIHDIIKNK